MRVANSKRKNNKVDEHKEDISIDVLITMKEITSTSKKDDVQIDSTEQLHFKEFR